MSDLAQLMGATRSDVLPGYTLSPFGLADYGELEAEFARDYLATVAASAEGLSPAMQKMILDRAQEKIAKGDFNYGSREFDAYCMSARYLSPLLHVCLRIKHPTLSRIDAAKLITRENELDLKRAVLEMAGFKFGGEAKKPVPSQTAAPSTGETSARPSASAA